MGKIHVIKVVPIQIKKNIFNKNFHAWCGRCGKLAALGADFVKMVLICLIAINIYYFRTFGHYFVWICITEGSYYISVALCVVPKYYKIVISIWRNYWYKFSNIYLVELERFWISTSNLCYRSIFKIRFGFYFVQFT